jgi:histone deacetylase 11
MAIQTSGTIMAGRVAMATGWCINLGGGFHHCSGDCGGGFCPYADITLAIRHLIKDFPGVVNKVMIVDLDAHQGNGHERDFIGDNNVYITDMYNPRIYPGDTIAKKRINR